MPVCCQAYCAVFLLFCYWVRGQRICPYKSLYMYSNTLLSFISYRIIISLQLLLAKFFNTHRFHISRVANQHSLHTNRTQQPSTGYITLHGPVFNTTRVPSKNLIKTENAFSELISFCMDIASGKMLPFFSEVEIENWLVVNGYNVGTSFFFHLTYFTFVAHR